MWEMFVKAFSDLSMSCATVFQWHNQFAVGEESIEVPEQSGGPGIAETNEDIARVATVLKNNRRASCRMRAESTRILKTIVHRILSDDLKK